MPEISRFFGIIIRMYAEPDVPHHQPHFHAYYQEYSAIFNVNTTDVISGELPRKQQRLVEAWAEIHQNELIENWLALQSGDLPQKIKPLE